MLFSHYKKICHVNMIKCYIERNNKKVKPVSTLANIEKNVDQNEIFDNNEYSEEIPHLKNSEVISNLNKKLEHLSLSKRHDISDLINDFKIIYLAQCQSWRYKTHQTTSIPFESN